MTKTYTAKEVTEILDIEEHTLYTWIKMALPEELKPKKRLNKKLGRAVYYYTDVDIERLTTVSELRKGTNLKYEEIRNDLLFEVIKESLLNTGFIDASTMTTTNDNLEESDAFTIDKSEDQKIEEEQEIKAGDLVYMNAATLMAATLSLLMTGTILYKIIKLGF